MKVDMKKKLEKIISLALLVLLSLSVLSRILIVFPEVQAKDDVGFTFIRRIGNIFHVWNNIDSYYINDTGVQLTNYLEEYWSHNIWGLRILIGENWYLLWSDSLNWSWVNDTDQYHHWVLLNGTTTYTQGGYSAIFRVRYYLADDYKRINISLRIKNTGKPIDDFDFGWLMKDINIGGTYENDTMEVWCWADPTNHTKGRYMDSLDLSENITLVYSHIELAKREYFISDSKRMASLQLAWDDVGYKNGNPHNLTYHLGVDSTYFPTQYNAPNLLLLHGGGMQTGDIVYAHFWWIDATTTVFNPSWVVQPNPAKWTTPQNAYTSNNQNATGSVTGCRGEWYNYSCQDLIGEGSEISKIEVGIEYSVTDSSDMYLDVYVSWDAGSTWSDSTKVSSDVEELLWLDATSLTDWTIEKVSDPNLQVGVTYVAGSSGCFAKDTLIAMADGTQKPIQHIRVGDELLAYNKKSQVVTKFTPHNPHYEPVLFHKITLENTEYLVVYGKHKIPIDNRLNTKRVDALEIGDTVYYGSELVRIIQIETVYLTEFYNLRVSKSLLYANNVLIHNLNKEPWTAYLDWLPVRITYSVVNYTLTYYYHTGCESLYVDGDSKANGTTQQVLSGSELNITSVPLDDYAFYNYTYDSSTTTDNPWMFTVNGNYTIHAYFLSYVAYTVSSEHLLGSTTQISGIFPDDLEENDESYKVFRPYESTIGNDVQDFVDNNVSNVDGVDDLGTHSNFTKQTTSVLDGGDTMTMVNSSLAVSQNFYVDDFINIVQEWSEVGNAPWLHIAEDGAYIHVSAKTDVHERFTFDEPISVRFGTLSSVELFARLDCGSEKIRINVYDGSSYSGDYDFSGSGYQWHGVDVSSFLNTKQKVIDAGMKVESIAIGGWGGSVYADACYLRVNYTYLSFDIDLEVQFTGADFDEESEELCIYGNDASSWTSFKVEVWNGVGWDSIISPFSAGWNNVSVSSYLTSSVLTIHFIFVDTSASFQWYEINATLLHVWTIAEYTMEVEFDGQSDAEDWINLRWSVDSSLTNASVSVTLHLYNYTAGEYSTSGDGYISYTSSGTPNTDELKTQTITNSPTDFRNGTNYWWVKITAVKTVDQFDWKGDWIELRVFTYPSAVITITFYYYNGGYLLVNGTETINGTSTEYSPNTILNLTGVKNKTGWSPFWKHDNFTWSSGNSTNNPYYFTVSTTDTIHTYFEPNRSANLALVFTITLISIPLLIILWKGRRRR